MTVETGTVRCNKEVLNLALKETLEEIRSSKRHYKIYKKLDLANPYTTPIKVSRKSLLPWTPSKQLIEHNKKSLICYGESKTRKRLIEGKRNTSIINMIGFENRKQRIPKTTTSLSMKKLLSYKDGPKFRVEKIAENVCKIDMKLRSRTPEAMTNKRLQKSEYILNKSNIRSSKIFLS